MSTLSSGSLRSFEQAPRSSGLVETVAAHAATRARLTECLDEHGAWAGQTQVFSKDPWKVLWRSSARRAYVPFLERRFLIVGWRDPVGPADEHAALLRGLLDYAHRRGKSVCLLGASAQAAELARPLGFGAVWIGREQEFDLSAFHLRGGRAEKVRLAVNHARRTGCRGRELFPLTSASDFDAIRRIERAWKQTRRALRTDSFLRAAPFEYAYLRRYFGVETTDSAGERTLQALVVCSRVSPRRYYLQDFIRRPEAPRGATELAVVEAFEGLRAGGVAFATMGIVPFFGPKPTDTPDRWSDVAQLLMRRLVYRFDGLQQFRAKFCASRVEAVYALHHPRSFPLRAVGDLVLALAPAADFLRRVE